MIKEKITKNEDALISTINQLSEKMRWNIFDSSNVSVQRKRGEYDYIPYSFILFFQKILFVKDLILKSEPNSFTYECSKSFIDYGCGVGLLMSISRGLGFYPYGFEINNCCIKNSISNVKIGDLNDMNLYLNKSYDVVYYYSPFTDRKKEVSFEINAIKTVKINGYLIAPGPGLFGEFYRNRMSGYTLGIKTPEDRQLYNSCKNFKNLGDDIFKRIK